MASSTADTETLLYRSHSGLLYSTHCETLLYRAHGRQDLPHQAQLFPNPCITQKLQKTFCGSFSFISDIYVCTICSHIALLKRRPDFPFVFKKFTTPVVNSFELFLYKCTHLNTVRNKKCNKTVKEHCKFCNVFKINNS